MKYTFYEKISSVDFSTLVETLKLSEQSRDFELALSCFSQIWEDLTIDPDFSDFPPKQRAELFRLCGYFLSYYGKIKNLNNYQERGKNLLTRAIDLFQTSSDFERMAEAQNALALCYFYEGAIPEAEIILEETAKQFLQNQLNLVYLQNRGNLLLTKIFQKKYQEALAIIKGIEIPMEFCPDKKTCLVFYEKAGLTYRGIGQYETALFNYNKAIQLAYELNNIFFICSIKNNISFLYNKIKKFDLAHFHINQAIELAKQHKHNGWLPHYLDTKALIYYQQTHFSLAIETIEKAIFLFKQGEDANGLTEALWNKCKFLLALDRKEEAITLFGELLPIAGQKMGEFAVKNFVKEFSEIIHIKQNGSLEDEVQRFKRIEIVNAIRQAKFNLYDAAEILKTPPNQLIKTIDKEFPELYHELDILQVPDFNENSDSFNFKTGPRNINPITLNGIKLFFNTQEIVNYSTYFFSKAKMSEFFGIFLDSIVAVKPLSNISAGDLVLVHDPNKNTFSLGKVNYDKILNLFYFESNDEPMPISIEDVELIGQAIGFCPIEETENEKLFLKPLPSFQN